MTDKELLEAAARVAVIEVEHRYEEPSHFRGLLLKAWKAPNTMAFWNPLTDDGDALRLLVKLGLRLDTSVVDGKESVCSGMYVAHQIGRAHV